MIVKFEDQEAFDILLRSKLVEGSVKDLDGPDDFPESTDM